jgi:hypothetical protein
MTAKVVSLAAVKRSQIIAQYVKFYGTAHDNTRKEAQK